MEALRRPRLLIDQSLSPRLVRRLADLFPGSTHVLHQGLDASEDHDVQAFASAGQFVLLSKDADHAGMARRRRGSPRVIRIRLGNCGTVAVERLLRARYREILDFLATEDLMVLELP